MRPHAQRGDHALNLRQQRLDGGVIQMVIVIVGDNQQVDLRHALRTPRVLPRKRFIEEGERCGVATQYRIDQDAFPRQLHIPGRVTEPHQRVLFRRQARQIGFHQRQRLRRTGVFGFTGKELPPRHQHILLPGKARRRERVMELPVAIVRRGFHFRELRTLRWLAKSGIQYKR